jgi:hypothetical protein
MEDVDGGRAWTFFTHHGHVLITLARDPSLRLRDIAGAVGVTERATATLVSELVRAGYLQRFKEGRRNRYRVDLSGGLRHQVTAGVSVGAVFTPLVPVSAPVAMVPAVTLAPRVPQRIPLAR